jgi:hypothetical protein
VLTSSTGRAASFGAGGAISLEGGRELDAVGPGSRVSPSIKEVPNAQQSNAMMESAPDRRSQRCFEVTMSVLRRALDDARR